jgi:hypothetical protein
MINRGDSTLARVDNTPNVYATIEAAYTFTTEQAGSTLRFEIHDATKGYPCHVDYSSPDFSVFVGLGGTSVFTPVTSQHLFFRSDATGLECTLVPQAPIESSLLLGNLTQEKILVVGYRLQLESITVYHSPM